MRHPNRSGGPCRICVGDCPSRYRYRVAGQYYYNVAGYQANSTVGNNPYIMRVTATTAVPEPASSALVGFACLGLGIWLRHRRSI